MILVRFKEKPVARFREGATVETLVLAPSNARGAVLAVPVGTRGTVLMDKLPSSDIIIHVRLTDGTVVGVRRYCLEPADLIDQLAELSEDLNG